MSIKKIVVLTSGGDAPGMNAAIRAVVRTCHHFGIDVIGCKSGFQGLIDQNIIKLEPETVANCIHLGGTILKAGRCLAFHHKDIRDQCRAFLKQQHVDGMIIIGGNGSFRGAALLAEEGGPPIIGIPGSIDNDMHYTDYTIGFDTARNTALAAIDRIRDTASSHDRNFLVEVMGRSSGFLALDVGIAGGAAHILLPEFPITIEELAAKLNAPRRMKQSSIIIVAEADQPGRSIAMAESLSHLTGEPYRVCILGHTQRGGSPSLLDRKVASMMGHFAVKSLCEGVAHQMIGMHQDNLHLHAFPAPSIGPRILTERELIDLNDVLCS